MEIVSRKEFKDVMLMTFPAKKLDSKHPLWIPEKDFAPKVKCIKFVRTNPVKLVRENKDEYWRWCNETLNGTVRCFTSGDEDEWWGFTDPDDVVIWTLRWAR